MSDQEVSRRAFLGCAGAAAGTAVLASASRGAHQPPGHVAPTSPHASPAKTDPGDTPRVRKDVATLTGEEIETFRQAVQAMKNLPPDDPRSWVFQAGVHGYQFAQVYPLLFNQCQHAHWWFLPWHRMYLFYAERIMRKLLADEASRQPDPAKRARDVQKAKAFAIPYWNYLPDGQARFLPAAFRTPADYSNALWEPRRGAGINGGEDGSQLPASAVKLDAFACTNFYSVGSENSFGGKRVDRPSHVGSSEHGKGVENTPHNAVHNWVGATAASQGGGVNGYMSDPDYAALDPIFWLHHANIDRLWDVWRALGGGRQNPPAGTPDGQVWREQTFLFLDENTDPRARPVADFVDTAALGYSYGPTTDPDMPAVRPAPVAAAAAGMPRASARQPEKLTVLGSAAGDTGPRPGVVGAAQVPDRGGFTLGTKSDTATIRFPANNRRQVVAATEGAANKPSLFLTVEGLSFPARPGAYYEVYLNLPARRVPAPSLANYIGNLTTFSLVHRGHGALHGGEGLQFRFDITDAVAKLETAGQWAADQATVTFVRRAPGGPGAAGLVEVIYQNITISVDR